MGASVPLVVRVPMSEMQRIDEIARQAGLTRSQLVRVVFSGITENSIPSEVYEIAEGLRPLRHATA
jgi:hypothetical protein